MREEPAVTFVIPAKNEEAVLHDTLSAITRVVGNAFSYEIILIDNGSTDSTREIAVGLGALVIERPEDTLGALRNVGASRARSEILVFLDADVILDPCWLNPFIGLKDRLHKSPMLISGSRCQLPTEAGQLAHSWFWAAEENANTSHIGTGHMITSMTLFRMLEGFDETLITGEDFDFCVRARKCGATIFRDQRLKVFHLGYPKGVKQFFHREIWHGSGDAGSIGRIIESKVALTAMLFFSLHLLAVYGLLAPRGAIFVMALLGVAAICICSSIFKYRSAPVGIIGRNSLIFYIYYWARALSTFNGIAKLTTPSSPRNN